MLTAFLRKCTLATIASIIVVVAGCGPAAGPDQPGQAVGPTPTTNLPPAAQLSKAGVTTGVDAAATIAAVEANLTAQAQAQAATAEPSAAATIEAIESTLTAQKEERAATREAQAHLSESELIATRTADTARREAAQQAINAERDTFANKTKPILEGVKSEYTVAQESIWTETQTAKGAVEAIRRASREMLENLGADVQAKAAEYPRYLTNSASSGRRHETPSGLMESAWQAAEEAFTHAWDAIGASNGDAENASKTAHKTAERTILDAEYPARKTAEAANKSALDAIKPGSGIAPEMVVEAYLAALEKIVAEYRTVAEPVAAYHRAEQERIVKEHSTTLESIPMEYQAVLERIETETPAKLEAVIQRWEQR